jgi:ribonuclease P/MRP protein subunit POP5
MFRSKRSIVALAKTIGIPEIIMKKNMTELNNRIALNREKLSNKMIAPGIWTVDEKIKSKEKIPGKKIKSEKLIKIDKIELEKIKNESKNAKQQERQRYLLFEIIKKTKKSINEKDLMDSFWKVFADYFGIFSSSQSGIYLTKYDENTSLGILRCSHQSLNSVRATFSLLSKINHLNVIVHVMKTSGTLKNLINITKKQKK